MNKIAKKFLLILLMAIVNASAVPSGNRFSAIDWSSAALKAIPFGCLAISAFFCHYATTKRPSDFGKKNPELAQKLKEIDLASKDNCTSNNPKRLKELEQHETQKLSTYFSPGITINFEKAIKTSNKCITDAPSRNTSDNVLRNSNVHTGFDQYTPDFELAQEIEKTKKALSNQTAIATKQKATFKSLQKDLEPILKVIRKAPIDPTTYSKQVNRTNLAAGISIIALAAAGFSAFKLFNTNP